MFLAQDKAVAKKLFAFHGIRTPYFATAWKGRTEHADDVSFPLIVKPMWEDGSIGIDDKALVGSVKELMERIEYVQEEFDCPALIEEYIEGREIYGAVLGSYERAEALPLVELDLSKLPKGVPRIATQDVKFEKDTDAYKLTKSALAEDLDEETTERLTQTALNAYRACKLRDYGRIDMRLSRQGRGVRDRGQSQSLALQRAGIRHGRAKVRPHVHPIDRRDRGNGGGALQAQEQNRIGDVVVAHSCGALNEGGMKGCVLR